MDHKYSLKKILILLIFSFINLQINANYSYEFQNRRILPAIRNLERNNKRVSLVGSISSPEDTSCPHIYISYNGKLIKVKNSSYSLFTIKDFDSNNIGLLFTSPENICLNSEDNTVSFLKVFSEENHKYYNLTKTSQYNDDEDNEILTWNIKELKLNNENKEIPLNTIIVLIDPNSIEFDLENITWKKTNNIIELPRIVIESINDEVDFEKSCLAFMNIKCLHREQDRQEVIRDNTKLSILI